MWPGEPGSPNVIRLLPSAVASVSTALIVAALVVPRHGSQAGQEAKTITVAQDGSGDFNGTDGRVLRDALKGAEPGTILTIGPGTYAVRRPISLPRGIVVRGTPGAVLQLPSPVRCTESSPAGQRRLFVDDTSGFTVDTHVQILPPAGSESFADGETRRVPWQRITSIEEGVLELEAPLPVDIPPGSRVGYTNHIFRIGSVEDVLVENLTFDGGLVEGLPMPGHFQRTAVWVSAPSAEGKRAGPPVSNVTFRHCVFRNCYGRGLAFYYTVDSLVEGCLFKNIADEAIDFDHFSMRCEARGNEIERAIWGIVLNDAAHCVVEHNRISGCDIGIFGWWRSSVPPEGLNEFNTVRHNFVRGSSDAAIRLTKDCHRNIVEQNFVEGAIDVSAETNRVVGNTQLERRPMPPSPPLPRSDAGEKDD